MKITIDRNTIQPHDLKIFSMENEDWIVITEPKDREQDARKLADVIRQILDGSIEKIHAVRAIREVSGDLRSATDIYQAFEGLTARR